MAWHGNVTVVDRVWAALPYLLPIASSSLALLPVVPLALLPQALSAPLESLLMLYLTVSALGGPYGGLLVFFGLYLFVVRNPRIAHFIRYNTMQSMMIGIAVSLVSLVFSVVNLQLLPIVMLLSVFSLGASLYALFYVVQGKYPEIKWLSDAAYAQTRI